jgi:hypothetical protein
MLQGVGAGMTYKQVCLLASLQVLGGGDIFLDPRPYGSKSVTLRIERIDE